jgi:cysteine desulfurase
MQGFWTGLPVRWSLSFDPSNKNLRSLEQETCLLSMNARLYFDWNATAPLRPEARAAVVAALDVIGNPSSVHAEGRAARRLVEEARESVAALVATQAGNVAFTSGGTEANILALAPARPQRGASKLLVSSVEHASVLAGGRFPSSEVERLPVANTGQIDLSALRRRLAEHGVQSVVSVMLANNETGIIQPIPEVAALVHAAGGILHVDAVQGPGRIPCDINKLGADLLTLSGHKIGAPKGVGALIRRDARLPFPPALIAGGGQERGARAGTENVLGIAGFGAAAKAALATLGAQGAHLLALRGRLEVGLKGHSPPGLVIFGGGVERLPNTTLFTVPGLKAETAVIALDLAGAAVSSGAACSSGKVQRSHVLTAMGVPAGLASGAVRISFGWSTSEAEVDGLINAWIKVSGTLLNVGAADEASAAAA